MRKLIALCGPTASGKSAAAIELAKRMGGVIINGDAIQVYKQMPILSASPCAQDKACIPHYLYNYIDATGHYSAARYVQDAVALIASLPLDVPIILVGGSGMYINALIQGMHKIPDTTGEVKQKVASMHQDLGPEKMHQQLIALDPASKALNPLDSKRVQRAYEVLLQTGKAITSFYTSENFYQPLAGFNIQTVLVSPERELLYQMCDQRFDQFILNGAIDEVRSLLENFDQLSISSKKTLGLMQLTSYLKGHISLLEACQIAKQNTRHFAKRQITWFKHQLQNPIVITAASNLAQISLHIN